jgi:hypothetical protein
MHELYVHEHRIQGGAKVSGKYRHVNPSITELGIFCTHIFKIIFVIFFHGSINRLN